MRRGGAFFVLFVGAILTVVYRAQITDRFGEFERRGVAAEVSSYEDEVFVSLNETRTELVHEIVFEDGGWATGSDYALADVRAGEEVTLMCWRDRERVPFIDPGWYRCTDARLISR